MDLVIVTALAVQCGCEGVCPLGTCLDPRWLAHCLDNCHSVNDSHLSWWQWSSYIGDILWLLITTSFVWQLFKCCKEESLTSTGIPCNAHKSSSDFHDAVDVLKSMICPNGTEWDLVLVDGKVSIHELLVYDLKGCHLCKVQWNQSSIRLLVMSKVLPQSIEG